MFFDFIHNMALLDWFLGVRFVAFARWAVLFQGSEDETACDAVEDDAGDDPVGTLPTVHTKKEGT